MANGLLSFDPVQTVTMSSMEMVDFINLSRGNSELTHANFLAKVPKVLGETSHSFECDLPDSYGRSRRGYRFPKREACLMAMSYSYELQARVFDRMTELEAQLAAPAMTPLELIAATALQLNESNKRIVKLEQGAEENSSRIQALEDQRATKSVHFKDAPLGWNIKSRQIERLRKGMVIEPGRRVRLSVQTYESLFDYYHEELFTGRTCDNPNPAVPGNRPCNLFDDKTVNDVVRRVLTRARRLSDGKYEHKAVPHAFKIFEITE